MVITCCSGTSSPSIRSSSTRPSSAKPTCSAPCALFVAVPRLCGLLGALGSHQAAAAHPAPVLVTLTVKDGPDLAERFAHLHKAQRELWKRKHRIYESSLDGVEGAVWSYEIKRGQGSGLWHPHLHMIALAEVEPDAEMLSREWHEITGDSFIVDVRPISQDDPVSGFIEVFKYAVKFSDQEPADTVHAWQQLKGKRLLASSGCFRGVDIPEELTDDASDVVGLPFMDMLYRYTRAGYSLQLVTPGQDAPIEARKAPKKGREGYPLTDYRRASMRRSGVSTWSGSTSGASFRARS